MRFNPNDYSDPIRDKDCPDLPRWLSWKDVLDEKVSGTLQFKSRLAVSVGYRYFIHCTLVWEVDPKTGRRYRHNVYAEDVVK
jgi:hypothetical protein